MQSVGGWMEKEGVAILVPVSDSVPGRFIQAVSQAQLACLSRGMAFTLLSNDSVPLDAARERLLSEAMACEPRLKYVLWLDADMLCSVRHMSSLIDFLESRPEADAASALYFSKKDFEPLCYRVSGPPDERGTPLSRLHPEGSAPVEIDAAGLGCMLIRSSSLQKLLDAKHKRLFWFDPEGHSEDINFCLLLKKAGMRLFLLPGIVVPHAGGVVSDWHYKKKREEKK
jgi:GT2 family glycosyltransferase